MENDDSLPSASTPLLLLGACTDRLYPSLLLYSRGCICRLTSIREQHTIYESKNGQIDVKCVQMNRSIFIDKTEHRFDTKNTSYNKWK